MHDIQARKLLSSLVSAVADPGTSERGPRNMKYKLPHTAAIFFGLFLQARGGGMAPLPPPPPPADPLLECGKQGSQCLYSCKV